ncbi:putative glycoside hydrolase [Aeromonas veronii]|uniref:putative glycoside hydrolase n=2 Tax=Aeromonas veronii TaxID=654 RepID=UPI001F289D18|nr:putative glycoside hydrolase [Aeromonas veronii]
MDIFPLIGVVSMNATKKGLLATLIAAALLGGCGGEENMSSSNGSETPPGETPPGGEDGALLLFGVGANAKVTPNIQSEKNNWNLQPVTATPVAMTSISAVLINNAGTDDTADVQVAGDGDGTFMLKSATPLNLSKYASGFIEFQLRTKSKVPEVLNASIDNEYPNRSSLPIASALTGSGDWETLTLPINCMKPFPGATAIKLATVGTPFHLATKEAFNYEITNIKYLLTTTAKPVVDPITCEAPGTDPGTDPGTGSGVNNAPALGVTDTALYYSGDKSQAIDRTAAYPVGSWALNGSDILLTDENQIVTIDLLGNGGVFLGSDSADGDLSAYQDGAMLLDLKVSSYGNSPNIQIRMDGTAGPDVGTFFTMDSNIVPDDDTWYRCILPVASLIPAANTGSVQKALHMGGAWDDMAGLRFSFTNVALKTAIPADFDSNQPCQQIN